MRNDTLLVVVSLGALSLLGVIILFSTQPETSPYEPKQPKQEPKEQKQQPQQQQQQQQQQQLHEHKFDIPVGISGHLIKQDVDEHHEQHHDPQGDPSEHEGIVEKEEYAPSQPNKPNVNEPHMTILYNHRPQVTPNSIKHNPQLQATTLLDALTSNPTFKATFTKQEKLEQGDEGGDGSAIHMHSHGKTHAVLATVVQASHPFKDEKVDSSGQNIYSSPQGFVGAATTAYNKHYDLVLRPDDVWQAILTQFSLYVQNHAEDLRDKIVDFKGKKELTVYSAGTLFTTDFGRMALSMAEEQITANIKDASLVSWLMPSFTTTQANDRIAASVAVMSSLQKYFDFKFVLSCGLPSVTLLGTVEDWEALRSKIDRLLEFDIEGSDEKPMKEWHALLAPILDEFVKTKQGADNMNTFWERICHYEGGGSGPSYLTGWITAFAVFDENGKWQGSLYEGYSIMGKFKSDWPLIDTQDIPSGVVSVPVLVDDNGTKYRTHMLSGQFAFSGKESTLQPRTDWCIALTDHELAHPH